MRDNWHPWVGWLSRHLRLGCLHTRASTLDTWVTGDTVSPTIVSLTAGGWNVLQSNLEVRLG